MFAVKIAVERQEGVSQLLTRNALFVLACTKINASRKFREKSRNQPMAVVIYNRDG